MNACKIGPSPHAFTPQAVMARVRAHAAQRAAELAARTGKFQPSCNLTSADRPSESVTVTDLTPADPLAAIAAELDRQLPEPPRPALGAPSADEVLAAIDAELNERGIASVSLGRNVVTGDVVRIVRLSPEGAAALDLTASAIDGSRA